MGACAKVFRGRAGRDRRRNRRFHRVPVAGANSEDLPYRSEASKTAMARQGWKTKKEEQALKYLIDNEEGLKVYVEGRSVPMTNSLADRTIRSFAIGRRNWLFLGSPRGREAAASCIPSWKVRKRTGSYRINTYATYWKN